jgi:hypothetical protein
MTTNLNTGDRNDGTISSPIVAERILAAVQRVAADVDMGRAYLADAEAIAFQALDCLSSELGKTSRGAEIMTAIGRIAFGLTHLRVGQQGVNVPLLRHGNRQGLTDCAPPVCRAVPYGRALAEAMR